MTASRYITVYAAIDGTVDDRPTSQQDHRHVTIIHFSTTTMTSRREDSGGPFRLFSGVSSMDGGTCGVLLMSCHQGQEPGKIIV